MINETSTLSPEHIAYVDYFLAYAFGREESILCPCRRCLNRERTKVRDDVRLHLMRYGFEIGYDVWCFHGEVRSSEPIVEKEKTKMDIMVDNIVRDFKDDPNVLATLLGEKEKLLYPGSSHTVISFVMEIFNMKGASSWSDCSVDVLFKFLHKILPPKNEAPKNLYGAKKILCPFELEYEKIHACPNDCILYRGKELKDESHCPVCKASRWDTSKRVKGDDDGSVNKVPAKCVWYLPIIPRLERMFGTKEDAKNLTWYCDRERPEDDVIRHPSDGDQWKKIDSLYPEFAEEKRNIRFALSTDGKNPFGNMDSKHSSWPVMMVIYNLPPYLCMKRKYMLMPLMISGPKQPGNDIDVFLAPLIEDLKKLWSDGVFILDAYRNEKFTLKAMLFCTVSDYPALGNLAGYMVKGHRACPVCEEETDFKQLKYGRKTVYLGYRKFLTKNHPYRQDIRGVFGGVEKRVAPKILSGRIIHEKMKKLKVVFGKKIIKVSKHEKSLWKKRSIFFDLPYWEDLDVRHCLDVMHIEKNVCDSLIGTLLNIPSKTKDTYNARRDMIEMGFRTELAPEIRGKRSYLPPGPCNLSKDEKKSVCDSLKSMKVPIGYSSNIRRYVTSDAKLSGLKSHDCHVLMQQLLPVAIRGVLDDNVRECVTRLCFFFHSICRKNIERDVLDALEIEAVEIICELELYFPPAFFDVMVHLIVHVVREIRICGPTNYHWMYPFERQMGIFKNYSKCNNRPDASIVERYVTEEVIEYCTAQLEGGIDFGVPTNKHIGRRNGVPRSRGKLCRPMFLELKRAHHYVLRNSSETVSFVDEHLELLTQQNPNTVLEEHNNTFVDWFYERCNEDDMDENLKAFSRKPDCTVREYTGYDVNGFSFSTALKDKRSTTQSSGVYVDGEQVLGGGKKDKHAIISPYYGVIQSIWELDYNRFKVVVFKCKWVDCKKGVDLDDPMGFTRVNLNVEGSKDDCFILASQARQVFYVNDPLDEKWCIVLQGKKYFFEDEIDYQMTTDKAEFPSAFPQISKGARTVNVRRQHDDGLWVDESGNLIYEDANKERKRKR